MIGISPILSETALAGGTAGSCLCSRPSTRSACYRHLQAQTVIITVCLHKAGADSLRMLIQCTISDWR